MAKGHTNDEQEQLYDYINYFSLKFQNSEKAKKFEKIFHLKFEATQ